MPGTRGDGSRPVRRSSLRTPWRSTVQRRLRFRGCQRDAHGLLSGQGGESSLDSDSVLIGVPRLIVSSVGGAPSRTGQKNTFLCFCRQFAYNCLQFVDKIGKSPLPRERGGPCQAVDAEDNTLCGETWSTCWYGKTKKGVHFCSSHRGAWEQFKLNGTAEKADEATALTEVHDLLGTRYCEPSRMGRKQRRNEVGKDASSLQFCVQGTFNCAQDDERGEPDTRWLTLDELVEAGCSRQEFNGFCATYVKELQETMKKDAKRFKSVP